MGSIERVLMRRMNCFFFLESESKSENLDVGVSAVSHIYKSMTSVVSVASEVLAVSVVSTLSSSLGSVSSLASLASVKPSAALTDVEDD